MWGVVFWKRGKGMELVLWAFRGAVAEDGILVSL